MSAIPVVAFAAYSGTGKTTLIEKLVVELKRIGLRVAVIKHDAHDFEIDHEGKDSWRFAQAGADMTIISSASKTAIIEQRERTLEQNISMVHDVDLILVEGYKHGSLPQIGIYRTATGQGLPAEIDRYIAVVTDDHDTDASVPHFGLEDITGLTAFVMDSMGIIFPGS
ncbi:MAG: molybdopterin-guanine dinucleotide biosynthesis protein B [Syntrophomonadaceae bacterium]|nr:molybdopterin-guanine dinucleotide biosynthesis protein B [Syntrophomonadaceae bacterium]